MLCAAPKGVKPRTQYVVLGLGSNLGDRAAALQFAREQLSQRGFPWLLASPVIETEPIGGPIGQQPYLNQVVAALLDTVRLTPAELLQVALEIEFARGRTRRIRWESRLLDLDLILWGDLIMTTAVLEIPHPRFRQRRFVLEPLAAVLPELVDPVSQLSIRQLLDRMADQPETQGRLSGESDRWTNND
jgi:2-amino-4-hydroxy-6-hydroxymethyldihydropteridine diphosphokinase